MELTNNPQTQRWLAVGLLVFVVLLVSLILVAPIISKGFELNESKENLAFTLKKYEQILAGKDAIVGNIAAIKQQHENQGYFNNQGTSALASAQMQEFIKQAIVQAGGQLSSTQVLPPTNKDKFSRITVSVRMTGNIEVLRAVLYKLETSTPLIVIEQLDIRPMRSVRNRITRQIEPSNDLNINFQAIGFMRAQTQ
ncbi:type II secretion system protein GspM [Methyloglobulus sp.]|uniref:type II secretion system protein GspM n=1 Tax=Methyloglobulus sp. TaxID=2518622 RepID=UPI001840091F|nr:general secretion pathway protein GspM [Methyloglobulus sp.]